MERRIEGLCACWVACDDRMRYGMLMLLLPKPPLDRFFYGDLFLGEQQTVTAHGFNGRFQ